MQNWDWGARVSKYSVRASVLDSAENWEGIKGKTLGKYESKWNPNGFAFVNCDKFCLATPEPDALSLGHRQDVSLVRHMRPTGGTLPLWPASRSHCWTVVRESVCRIWQSSSKTWRRKNAYSYLTRLWDLVPGSMCLWRLFWPWAEVVLFFQNVPGKLCLICCETSDDRIECLMADGETVQISPWALGHERVEGKCAAGNGIHAGKTWRMEGWASQFRLSTESSGSQVVPLAGPETQNTNTFLCYFSF